METVGSDSSGQVDTVQLRTERRVFELVVISMRFPM